MENSSKFFFDNTERKFFVVRQGKAVGPLTAHDVSELLKSGEVTLLHFYWQEGLDDWMPLFQEKAFSILMPAKPSSDGIDKIRTALKKMRDQKEAAAKEKRAQEERTKIKEPKRDEVAQLPPSAPGAEEPKELYLYYSSTQYGPFSHSELIHVFESHRVGKNAYMWRPGWANWKRVREVPEYHEFYKEEKTAVTSKTKKKEKTLSKISKSTKEKTGKTNSDKRIAPRRPFVARLFVHNDEKVVLAVCRDISIGGMQVLTDLVPGEVGSKIKLNVTPGAPSEVKGFVAEGEIVRVLEDGRGFSFRFTKISDSAKNEIERYLRENG